MGGLFLMEEKKTWAVGAGSGIGWLKALLVSYLISVLLLLLLSFLLWKFSWKESWVQAGIVVIYLASSFSAPHPPFFTVFCKLFVFKVLMCFMAHSSFIVVDARLFYSLRPLALPIIA